MLLSVRLPIKNAYAGLGHVPHNAFARHETQNSLKQISCLRRK